ncbi:UPF0236 family transposase-like protein [Rummeliibacillus suwonensis]|uniref:UPF0236 family transposase-like protein n=1 Tax=Rummeliibacillus suwonensis TaxID=1306154 RepID=UPI0011B51E8B|nr:UPF0236 family protein [Rummeliibacillus suwonensis]
MSKIISEIYGLIKKTENLIELEEHLQLLMYQVFSEILGDIFTQLDQVIVKTKQQENWVVKRKDSKTIQFIFGVVTFQHTLMGCLLQNKSTEVCEKFVQNSTA